MKKILVLVLFVILIVFLDFSSVYASTKKPAKIRKPVYQKPKSPDISRTDFLHLNLN